MSNKKAKSSLKQMWSVFTSKYCLVCKSFRFMKRAACKLKCDKSNTK